MDREEEEVVMVVVVIFLMCVFVCLCVVDGGNIFMCSFSLILSFSSSFSIFFFFIYIFPSVLFCVPRSSLSYFHNDSLSSFIYISFFTSIHSHLFEFYVSTTFFFHFSYIKK